LLVKGRNLVPSPPASTTASLTPLIKSSTLLVGVKTDTTIFKSLTGEDREPSQSPQTVGEEDASLVQTNSFATLALRLEPMALATGAHFVRSR
jgi:hypothetical protein